MKPESTRLKSILFLGAFAMLAFTTCAQAAPPVRCTITSGGAISVAYGSLKVVVAGNFTVDCINPGSATYYVRAAGTNLPVYRAVSGGNFILYGLYKDAACTVPWNTTYPAGLFTATITSPMTTGFNYYLCIPAGQTGLPTGTYTDTITVAFDVNSTSSPSNPSTFTSTAAVPVNIYAPATCTISTPPGNISFSYTSFGTAANANTSFAANCTNTLPYTMSLDATSGTIVGVNYSLLLNTTGTGGTHPLTSTGTGIAQTFYINGTIAAGQSGTCATPPTCSGSQTRTLTVTY